MKAVVLFTKHTIKQNVPRKKESKRKRKRRRVGGGREIGRGGGEEEEYICSGILIALNIRYICGCLEKNVIPAPFPETRI